MKPARSTEWVPGSPRRSISRQGNDEDDDAEAMVIDVLNRRR